MEGRKSGFGMTYSKWVNDDIPTVYAVFPAIKAKIEPWHWKTVHTRIHCHNFCIFQPQHLHAAGHLSVVRVGEGVKGSEFITGMGEEQRW